MKQPTKVDGVLIICRTCQHKIFICRSCYRGQRYCGEPCRDIGYQERQGVARKKHAHSDEGKLDHRDRNRVYRIRKKWGLTKKTVTDKGSAKHKIHLDSPNKTPVPHLLCHFCEKKSLDSVFNGGSPEDLELFTLLQNRRRRPVD